VREANLQPIQPGEVRNPKDINQYAYKRDFERAIDALLKGELSSARSSGPSRTRSGPSASGTPPIPLRNPSGWRLGEGAPPALPLA
jgi:hypothetical protein